MRREWHVSDAWTGAVLGLLVMLVHYVFVGLWSAAHSRIVASGGTGAEPWQLRLLMLPIAAGYRSLLGGPTETPEWVMLVNSACWGAAAGVVGARLSRAFEIWRTRAREP